MKKKITILTPTYNEEDNVFELCKRVRNVMQKQTKYSYDHLIIDNSSTDGTVENIKKVIKTNKKVRLIVNSRNFGHIRSPAYALTQTNADAVILIVSDLQDPPEMIPDLINKWEGGDYVVLAVKASTNERGLTLIFRKIFYWLISMISDIKLIPNTTGAGLYDAKVINILKEINDPYPYLRGIVSEIGLPIGTVEFHQPLRLYGKTKNNFLSLYDMAMLGITNYSKVPLRLISIFGFVVSLFSFVTCAVFFMYKLFYWDSFPLGISPILLLVLIFGAINSFFIGVLGEYLYTSLRYVRKFPLAVELYRVNFENKNKNK